MDERNRLPLRKFTAPEYVLGTGASRLAGSYAAKFGALKALVVSDRGVAEAGIEPAIEESLIAVGIEPVPFLEVSPNPREDEVRRGAALYLYSGCDSIVAVGGGSPMDCAKAIGLMATNGMDVLEFEGVDSVPLPGPPLICIPTTAGTAADLSQFAIINDTSRSTKFAIVSKKAIPDAALIDPETTVSMPADLTASTGMDALTHAVEAYVSTAASRVTDLNALEAIRLAARWLPRAVSDGGDREARNGMTLASSLAGLAFSNAGLGVVHSLAHALGGLLDLPHGLCNALLVGAASDYNFVAAPQRYADIVDALSEGFGGRGKRIPLRGDAASARGILSDLILSLRAEVGLSGGLGTRGLSPSFIPALARSAFLDACLATNPRKPSVADLEALYAAAL